MWSHHIFPRLKDYGTYYNWNLLENLNIKAGGSIDLTTRVVIGKPNYINNMFDLEFAGHFMKEKTLVGYSAHKNGKGHDDFEEPSEMYCKPSAKYNWADKQTALLTNRGVYSTANLFTSALKHAPNVIQVGQICGGGGGLPMTHHLPNGWWVVFASNILLDTEMNHIEPGIAPDYEAEIGDFKSTRKDGIVEKAIEELLKRI